MAFAGKGYLIKIGIRGFLWHDFFPGWRNCALRGSLPIPLSLGSHTHSRLNITASRLVFSLSLYTCLLSICTFFHFSPLHLINVNPAPVICRALSICHVCIMGPIFRRTSEIFHSVWKKWSDKDVNNCCQYDLFLCIFFLLSVYTIVDITTAFPDSGNASCSAKIILAYCIFFTFTCIFYTFSLHVVSGASNRVFIFHLSSILMISTTFPLRRWSWSISGWEPCRDAKPPGKLYGSEEMMILCVGLWGANISAVGNEQTVQSQRD